MIGSITLQRIDIVFCSWNGSITALAGSGSSTMSDSEISWKPRIEEPSKPSPSTKSSSSREWIDRPRCCQVPGRSVNLKSTMRTPCSWASARTSRAWASRPSRKRSMVSGVT